MALRTHPDFETWDWRTYSEHKKADLNEFIKIHSEKGARFYVGTDSQQKSSCVFTTALIAYTMGHGGSIITHSDKLPLIDNLRERLLMEAMRSLEVGWHLNSMISPEDIITIHVDVNENIKFKSGKYKDELVGLVMAQGFEVSHKPHSWAASSVADSRC